MKRKPTPMKNVWIADFQAPDNNLEVKQQQQKNQWWALPCPSQAHKGVNEELEHKNVVNVCLCSNISHCSDAQHQLSPIGKVKGSWWSSSARAGMGIHSLDLLPRYFTSSSSSSSFSFSFSFSFSGRSSNSGINWQIFGGSSGGSSTGGISICSTCWGWKQ